MAEHPILLCRQVCKLPYAACILASELRCKHVHLWSQSRVILQVELPIHWKLQDLTPEQRATLGDEAIARAKAREAYERQVEAESRERGGDDDRALEATFVDAPRERWDCESAASARSSTAYQPSRIGSESTSRRRGGGGGVGVGGRIAAQPVVALSAKSGLPLGVRGVKLHSVREGGSGTDSDDDDAAGQMERLHLCAARPKDESKEEKKARRAAVKDNRRAARAAKKQTKTVYAAERSRAQHQAATHTEARVSVVPIA